MKNLLKFSFLFLCLSLLTVSCKKKTAGEKAKTSEATGKAATSANATALAVNTANSKVYWSGTKPTGAHNGSINLSSGSLSLADGKLVGGNFEIDMNTITDLSQEGDGKAGLESHLKGLEAEKEDHFFNVKKYPTAKFVITNVADSPAGTGEVTHNITGDLTIKATTKSITIPASVIVIGNKVNAVAPNFKINRTEWGINFMSKSVFDDLKDKFIDDDIAINIQLEAGS